jgi:hypothetical protein
MGVISFIVWNESSFDKTFTFIDETNGGQAVYAMAPDEKRGLSLATRAGQDGVMKYHSNYTTLWTRRAFIKQGDVIALG